MLPDELEKRLDGIEDASKKGYPVRNLYKIACEPGLWLQAYVNIRANAGALTQQIPLMASLSKEQRSWQKHCGVENT